MAGRSSFAPLVFAKGGESMMCLSCPDSRMRFFSARPFSAEREAQYRLLPSVKWPLFHHARQACALVATLPLHHESLQELVNYKVVL